MYDPKTGQFTQEDPIGLAGGLNLYGYANGDPVNFSDPFGLCPPIEECSDEQRMLILGSVGERTGFLEGITNGIMRFFGGDKLVGGVDRALDGDLAGGAILIGLAAAENSPGGKAKHLLPGIGKGWTKLRGSQGWRDAAGNIWKKDKKHKDHWDISDRKGDKVREVDFDGNQIWPDGPKNRNKR